MALCLQVKRVKLRAQHPILDAFKAFFEDPTIPKVGVEVVLVLEGGVGSQ